MPPSRLNPELSPGLDAVIGKALEKDRNLRYQHASEIRADLQRLKRDTGSGSVSATTLAKSGAWGRSRRCLLMGVAVGLLVLLGTVSWLGWLSPPPRVLSATKITHDGVPKTYVLTDGSRLFLSERKVSDEILVQGSVAGGETSVLPMPFPDVYPTDISPDHSQLIIFERVETERESQAWILPLPVGAPRRLLNFIGHWAAWSRDGQQLLLARGNDLLLSRPDGSDAHTLATLPGSAWFARFSPDSRRIRFTLADKDQTYSLWEIRSDDTDMHRLFPAQQAFESEHDGVWTADGRYYLFRAVNGSSIEIWASRESTGILPRRSRTPVKLATGPLSYGQIAPSPYDNRLYVDGFDQRAELVRYDNALHQIVPYLAGISAGELDFSRDGQWVTYVSYPEGSLWKCRTDGSDRLQLTYPPMTAVLPRWAPDGKRIAFVAEKRGKPWRILLISSDGGTPEEAYPESRNQLDPTWSPDGKQIAFGRLPVPGTGEKMEIHVLNLASHQISVLGYAESLFSPRWSPDGQHVLAMTENSKKLMLYDLNTKKWSEWIDEPGAIAFPTWSRDGHYVYYDRVSTNEPSFRRGRVGENHSELLIDLKDLPRYFSAIGPWSGLTPDGSALFVRNLSTDEIYALDVDLP